MNLSSTLAVATPRFSPQQIRVRWAIVTAGVVVNAIILLPTLTQSQPVAAPASVTYLPPATQPSVLSDSGTASMSKAQTSLAEADALARAGQRDAAVEKYLESMTEYVNAQSR